MKRFILALALTLGLAGLAHADTCTTTVPITNASTKVLSANDVTNGRHILFLQNIGATAVYCSIGETATTTSGIYIDTTGSFVLEEYPGPTGVTRSVPNSQVNCISATEGLVTVCDY